MKKASILFISFIFLFIVVASCNRGISGNGDVTEKERNVGTFSKIEIKGVFNVYLSQGDSESLKVEIDDNLHQYIITDVVANTLNISVKDKINFNRTKKSNIYLTVKDINRISIGGVCNIDTKHQLLLNDLEISIGGVCNGDFNVVCKNLNIDAFGVSDCVFIGSVDNLNVSLSGTSNIDAKNLIADKVVIDKSGLGDVAINAVSELDVSFSGVGDIEYYGNPAIKNISKYGIGDVVKMQ